MFELPYIFVLYEDFIPYPEHVYSISIEDMKDNLTVPVKDIIYINDIKYTKAFIIIPVDKNNNHKGIGSLCELDFNTVEIKQNYISAKKKVFILEEEEEVVSFVLAKETKPRTKEVSILRDYISSNINLHFINTILLKSIDDSTYLQELWLMLNVNSKTNYDFYNSKDWHYKVSLISLELLMLSSNKTNKIKNSIVFDKIKKEKKRLTNMHQGSNDYSQTIDYINLLESIPWQQFSKTKIEIIEIESQLNKNHYGLTNVKNNILDIFYLTKLTNVIVGTNYLFVGPPGTGKTSIAKAIAVATKREFISISLGGTSDEAEIRGHRRTYIGAKAGRIVSELSRCKTLNPIICLDEIDKIDSYRGNPEAALLEVLDPEQNKQFIDRYLEVPIDLSNCIFICTANIKENISKPLLDRLEIIEFQDYNFEEKKTIFKNYIFLSMIKKYNLINYNIKIKEELVNKLCKEYNLRDLKKITGKLLRFSARKIYKKELNVVLNNQDYNNLYEIKTKERKIGFV